MFKAIQIFMWINFLPSDWYFVVHPDRMIRAAYWNGVVWEDRIEILADHQVVSVLGRVPNEVPQ